MKAARRRFADTYYRPGQQYRLLSDGAEAGSVTVKKLNACDAMGAEVEVSGSAKMEGAGGTLATNSDSLRGRASARREPTDAEAKAMMRLVSPIFRRNGLDDPVEQGALNSLHAADLNGDGRAELIGFYGTGAKSQHTLFIIAEPQGGGFKPTLLLFHKSRDKYGDDQRYHQFVDGIDLDGDGISEVITSGNDPRSTNDFSYTIYKKRRGHWQSIYVGGGLKCASEMGGEVY
jgi:hypothetical protein